MGILLVIFEKFKHSADNVLGLNNVLSVLYRYESFNHLTNL